MTGRPLILLLIAFSGGILTDHYLLPKGPSWILGAALALTLCLALLLFFPQGTRWPLCLALFFIGGAALDLCSQKTHRTSALAAEGARITLEGTVLAPPLNGIGRTEFPLKAEWLFSHGRKIPLKDEKVLVTLYRFPVPLDPGDRIRLPARLRPFRNFNNPGGYDYKAAMRLRGFACAASVADGRSLVPMGRGSLGPLLDLAEKGRSSLRCLLAGRLSPEKDALYRALLLGERQGIPPNLRESFQAAGLGHILAVSGLHIGLVAWLFFFLSKRALSLSYSLAQKTDVRKAAALLSCCPVIAYTALTGFQISGQRAMIMTLSYLVSIILGRDGEVWSTLALAALLILGRDPHALFSVSFQLSFCAVVAILWLGPRIHRRLPSLPRGTLGAGRRPMEALLAYFRGMIIVTLSVLIFLLPITVAYFHRFSLVGIPANLSVVPLLGFWVLPSGLLAALALPLCPSCAGLLLDVGAWGIGAIRGITSFWAGLPFSDVWLVTPNPFEIGLFYGFLFLLSYRKARPWTKGALLAVTVLILGDISYWVHRTCFNPHLKVTVLDVGQGNAALVQFPGRKRMLIDGGGFSRDTFDVGRMVVAPALLHEKIRRIDYLVLSHPESDHMNGLRFIAAHFGPREFWFNGDRVPTPSFLELMDIVEKRGITVLLPGDLAGGRVIGGVRLDILQPRGEETSAFSPRPSWSLNDRSLVLKLTCGTQSCLFPGDIEQKGETSLVFHAAPDLGSRVLLAPHHGSNTSCSRDFLRAVHPALCLVSCGAGNTFGFPHPEVLARLREIGCRVLRTDLCGAIRVTLGKEGVRVSPYLSGKAPRYDGSQGAYPGVNARPGNRQGRARGAPDLLDGFSAVGL